MKLVCDNGQQPVTAYISAIQLHDEFNMYLENYFGMYHKPKYSPDDLVWIPKEQLDELLKAAGR